jgi:diacylglycerol kinase (ATP)
MLGNMRAAAILGPGNLNKYVAKIQSIAGVEWTRSPDRANALVIFGGDGTVHRHLSSFVKHSVPVLVVPCGSGNDFARALGLKSTRDSVEAWRAFVSSKRNVRTIDLGIIRQIKSTNREAGEAPFDSAQGRPGPHQPGPNPTETHNHYFCCVAGVGIDGEIARRANRLPKWLRAYGGYALCTPLEFLRFTPFPLTISRAGTPSERFDPAILAAIANAPAYGGGMKIAPQAKLDDGKLDICIVHAMETFKLFCLFPTIYFGRHLGFKEVEYQQAEAVRIETGRPLDVYADGEFVCRTPVEFSVARNALRVIVPESGQYT